MIIWWIIESTSFDFYTPACRKSASLCMNNSHQVLTFMCCQSNTNTNVDWIPVHTATAAIRYLQHNRLRQPDIKCLRKQAHISINFPLDCSFLNTQPKDLARYTANENQVLRREIMTDHYTSTSVYANPKMHDFSFGNLIRTEYYSEIPPPISQISCVLWLSEVNYSKLKL